MAEAKTKARKSGDGEIVSALKRFDAAQIYAARSHAEIAEIAKDALALPSLSFSHFWEIFAMFACVGGVWLVLSDAANLNEDFVFVPILIFAIALGVMFYRRNVRATRLDAVLRQSAYLQYGIKKRAKINPRSLARSFACAYRSFSLGDEGQKVESICDGEFEIDGHFVKLSFYTFSYVIVTYVHTKNGTRKQRTKKSHHGVIISGFPFMPRMEMLSGYGRRWGGCSPHKWKTSMDDFNKLFRISCADEFSCARFLNPVTILELEKLGNVFQKLSIESLGAEMNVSFLDNDILDISIGRAEIIKNPALLKDALNGKISCPKLDFMLKIFAKIKEYNDKNF